MIRFLFVLFALFVTPMTAAEITVTDGPARRPLPKFVAELSREDYAVWAEWQNRQAGLRAEREAKYSYERPYITVNRTAVNSSGGRSSTMRANGTTTRNLSSRGYSKNGHSRRSQSSTTTRNMSANRNSRNWNSTTAETYPHRYVNPAYVPSGPVTVYSPYVKPEGGVGEPDWDNLFVPCEEGTMTLTEALDECRGPASPEKLYRNLLKEWF
jgi:hypothetical protein